MKPEEAISAIKNNMPAKGTYTILTEALELTVQALEKQVPKKPIDAHRNYYCPTCKDTWLLWDDAVPNESDNFCPSCGQKINWEETL